MSERSSDRRDRARNGLPIGRRKVLQGIAAMGAIAPVPLAFPALADTRPVRIGVLLPLTGDADIYAQQMRMGVETAIAEINAAGGVFGRTLEAAYADSATTPDPLEEECRKFVENDRAIAVIGGWISASRKFTPRYLAERGIPAIHATNHEGGFCHPGLFSLGPTTSHDGHALARHLVDMGASKKWFFVGSYPSWQNTMFRQIRFPVYPDGVRVLGHAATNTGERNFRPIIRWIQETGAETVVCCIMRHHGREFIAQAREMGLLDKITLGWIGYNEALNDGVAPADAARILTASPLASLDREGGVPDFVAGVRAQFGPTVPVSFMALTHYNAVKALDAAWRSAGEASPAAAMHGLNGLTLDSPTGPITIDAQSHHTRMNVVIARGGANGLDVVKRLGPIGPQAGCSVPGDEPV